MFSSEASMLKHTAWRMSPPISNASSPRRTGPLHWVHFAIGDGRDRATAAGALVASMKGRTRQEFFGDFVYVGEVDRAREREAGLTQSFAGGIHEQTAHRLLGRHRIESRNARARNRTALAAAFLACALIAASLTRLMA